MTDNQAEPILLAKTSLAFLTVLNKEYDLIISTLDQADGLLKDAFGRLSETVINVDAIKLQVDMASKNIDESKSYNFLQMLMLFSEFTAAFQRQLDSTIQALQAEDMISQLLAQIINSHNELSKFTKILEQSNQHLVATGELAPSHYDQISALQYSLQKYESRLENRSVRHNNLSDGGEAELF